MAMSFRKVRSPASLQAVIAFLRADVVRSGGSVSEIVDVWGTLRKLTVCQVPGGTLLIDEEITQLEALAWWLEEVE